MCLLYGVCRCINLKVQFTAVSAVLSQIIKPTNYPKTRFCFGRLEYTLLEFTIVIIITHAQLNKKLLLAPGLGWAEYLTIRVTRRLKQYPEFEISIMRYCPISRDNKPIKLHHLKRFTCSIYYYLLYKVYSIYNIESDILNFTFMKLRLSCWITTKIRTFRFIYLSFYSCFE